MSTTDERPAPAGQETFATATVARVYLNQGKLDQAEEILERLLAQQPGDVALERLLAEVRRRRQEVFGDAEDVVAVETRGGDLVCSFRVSPAGRGRAQLVLGGPGTLTLRLAGFPAAPGEEPRDVVISDQEGAVVLQAPPRVLMAAAAIGLRADDGRFVAIAHSKLVQIRENPPQD